jgi:hypothetical protein
MAKIAEAEYARALTKPEWKRRVLVSKPAPASGAQRPSGAWTDDNHRISTRIFSPTELEFRANFARFKVTSVPCGARSSLCIVQ